MACKHNPGFIEGNIEHEGFTSTYILCLQLRQEGCNKIAANLYTCIVTLNTLSRTFGKHTHLQSKNVLTAESNSDGMVNNLFTKVELCLSSF